MSTVQEERLVPKRVTVTRCDGPGCIREVTEDEYSHGRAKGWFELLENQGPIPDTYEYRTLIERGLIQDHLDGPKHFHDWKCFVAWVMHHRASPMQATTPLDLS
jgi:hypothetical protein